jgi:hypothetical protein
MSSIGGDRDARWCFQRIRVVLTDLESFSGGGGGDDLARVSQLLAAIQALGE